MKDTNFTIKIHDFLSKKTLSDTIEFTNKFSTSLPQIKEGLACSIDIQAGDEKTFMINICDISFEKTVMCDVCAKDYSFITALDDVYIKFFGDCDEELLKENEISFSMGDGVIDLEPLIVQEIQLHEQIKHVCTTCSKNEDRLKEEDVQPNNIKRS